MRNLEDSEKYIKVLQLENTKLHNENRKLQKELDAYRKGTFVAKNITEKEVKKK